MTPITLTFMWLVGWKWKYLFNECMYLLYICLLRENTNVCRYKYMKLSLKHILGSNPNSIEGIREHN